MSKLLEQINSEIETKEIIPLASLMTQITSKVNKIQKSDYLKSGLVPIYDQGDNDVSGYSNDVKNAYNGKLPVVIFGDHTLRLRRISSPFYLGADGNQLIEPTDDNVLDRNYFYYLLLSKKPRSYGYERHFKYLKEVEVKVPSLSTQKKIAEILSAYDAKIDNNNLIIKKLEATAQTLFDEWFVNFRFPGYEKVKFADTEIGEIPEGWEMKNVLEVIERISPGKKYDNKSASPSGSVPILDQGASGFIGYHDDEPGVIASIDNPVVVFTNHTCYYRILTEPFSCIQNVLPYIGKNGYDTFFVYFLTKEKIKMSEYKGHWPEFEQQVFVIPNPEIASRFSKVAKVFIEKIVTIEKENVFLKSQRDRLLAKLI